MLLPPVPARIDALCRRVIGAALAVHSELGPGFLESAYERALGHELAAAGIPFECQRTVPVTYRGAVVGTHRLDLVVGGGLIVELKCVPALADIHFAQLRSYLRATGMPLGLLINFDETRLRNGIRRVVNASPSSDWLDP